MRVAVISDVHSNLEALCAVFGDMADNRVDKFYCLGDIVGYAARPKDCFDLIVSDRRLGGLVRGNHDHYTSFFHESIEDVYAEVNEEAFLGIKYAHESLGPDRLARIRSWPETLDVGELDFSLAHGSISHDHFRHYVVKGLTFLAEDEMLVDGKKVVLVGHSHVPFVYHESRWSSPSNDEAFPILDGRYLINVGSVGQPRDGDNRACYCLFDFVEGKVSLRFRRVPYRIERTAKAIKGAGLPKKSGERLFKGE